MQLPSFVNHQQRFYARMVHETRSEAKWLTVQINDGQNPNFVVDPSILSSPCIQPTAGHRPTTGPTTLNTYCKMWCNKCSKMQCSSFVDSIKSYYPCY